MKRAITDLGQIERRVYNPESESRLVSQAGLQMDPQGALAATATRVPAHEPIVIYNPSNAVVYIAFGDAASLAAPTTAANGFPVLKDEKVVLNPGKHCFMRASAVGCFWYISSEALK